MRVVIDTNVFVSGLMLPASVPGRIVAASRSGGFEVILSEPMLEEISLALRYPKVRARIPLTDAQLDHFVQALRFLTEIVDSSEVTVQVPGDADDAMVLATLLAAGADWLVTGDAALLALGDRYPIVTPADFAARHLP